MQAIQASASRNANFSRWHTWLCSTIAERLDVTQNAVMALAAPLRQQSTLSWVDVGCVAVEAAPSAPRLLKVPEAEKEGPLSLSVQRTRPALRTATICSTYSTQAHSYHQRVVSQISRAHSAESEPRLFLFQGADRSWMA